MTRTKPTESTPTIGPATSAQQITDADSAYEGIT